MQPTLVTGLPDSARCVRSVRPGLPPEPFDSEDEVLRRTTTTTTAGRHRLDQPVARTAWHQLHVGIVWVSTWFSRDLRTPWRRRLSGIGREGGRWSLDFYFETTNICIEV